MEVLAVKVFILVTLCFILNVWVILLPIAEHDSMNVAAAKLEVQQHSIKNMQGTFGGMHESSP